MNEWSPGGNYSCPGTPNQKRRSFRTQRDDFEKGTKLHPVNTRGVSESKSRSCTQHSMEEISKAVLPGINRKAGGNGSSDPRFKRVIPPGVQNNSAAGGEPKPQKSPPVHDDTETPTSRFPIWSNTDFKTNKTWVDCLKDSELSKFKQRENLKQHTQNPDYFVSHNSAAATGPTQTSNESNYEQAQEHLKAVEKLAFNHDMAIKSVSKESLSEWTANSRNTSFGSEDRVEDFSNALGKIPSSTRSKKVQNWIHEQRPKLEKKHSVITVIGQMQEPDTFSSALQEIGKRRKLVKELDKFAVCRKLIEPDKEKEISDMVVKIKNLSNGGGILFSGSNETLDTSAQSLKFCEDKSNRTDNPSSDEKIRMLFSSLPYQKMFYILIIICGILCWFAFFSIENGPYVSFDLFSSRPKPMTWYERICNWLWEFFRPSGNYHRTTAWRSY